jgi:hypothetical protein
MSDLPIRTELTVLPADPPRHPIGIRMSEKIGIGAFNPKGLLLQGTTIMMNHLGISMSITCKKSEVLARLKTNRDQHTQLVKEAREGYVAKAQEELIKKLGLLKEGKIVGLSFTLKVPKDFTTVYNTTIGMLEAHTKEEIDLTADEYRHLMEDSWDWTRDFIASNVSYSKSTSDFAHSKGFFDVE